jgi:hypothetical protein
VATLLSAVRLVHIWSTRHRNPAVHNGLQRCILVQVIGGTLRIRGRVQSADKDEVPGSSPGRPTNHHRRLQRCRWQAGSAGCQPGPRWGRSPIPAGTPIGPAGPADPGGRPHDHHPPWSPPSPGRQLRGRCGTLALAPGPVPTAQPQATALCTPAWPAWSLSRSRAAARRHPAWPGFATDPTDHAISAASPASGPARRPSSRSKTRQPTRTRPVLW